jgi:serine/threonine-protein kinase RsbW
MAPRDSLDERPMAASLRIPADARWIALTRLVLSGLCSQRQIDGEVVSDIKLAVTEACSNSVRHAYSEDVPGTIAVTFEVSERRIAVEVMDEGQGLHREADAQPAKARRAEDLQEDEMGLAIITALVDELEIGPGGSGRGTRISFRRHLGDG